MSVPTMARPQSVTSSLPTTGLLQRKCACGKHTVAGGECAECKRKRETGTLQRSATGPVGAVPPIVHDVLRSPGQPLDAATRAHMEPRFGHDFSQVRVHTDAKAAESAQAVNAHAYAVGNHVAFGRGQYQPNSQSGQQLMAHELVHVVQQRSAPIGSATLEIGKRDSASEHEANDVARAVMRKLSTPSISQSSRQVARNGGKQKEFVASATDLQQLQSKMLQLINDVDDSTRTTITRQKTIAVGLVVDDDGNPAVVYTVNGNWTNKQLRAAADKAGLTRWEATPRAKGRGSVGAPGDAEQLMLEAADTNNHKVAAMAVSRQTCKDCKVAIKSYDQGKIKVIEVAIPVAPSKSEAKTQVSGKGAAPSDPKNKAGKPRPVPPQEVSGKKGGGISSGRPAVAPIRGRTGGEGAVAAGAGAAASAVADIFLTQLVQGFVDKKNEKFFQEEMKRLEPKIEARFRAETFLDEVERLRLTGEKVFSNVTISIWHQASPDTGITYLGQLTLDEVKASTQNINEQRSAQGLGAAFRQRVSGRSQTIWTFSKELPILPLTAEERNLLRRRKAEQRERERRKLEESVRLKFEECVKHELARPAGAPTEEERTRAEEKCISKTGHIPTSR